MIVYSLILFAVGILALAFGISLYKGNTKLIHDYHQANVRESQRREYGRAFANGLFTLCAALFLSGAAALFGQNAPILAASLIALFAGLAVSVILLIKAQKSTTAAYSKN